MSGPVDGELAVAAGRSRPAEQVRAFLAWVGEGRALTQTGRMRLTDARELVILLDTTDLPDQQEARGRITSSAELPELTTVVEWAKESRLVRVSRGRLVPVKKNVALLDRPLELWARMLEAFPRLGEALCPPGWAESLMRRHFQEAMDALFEELHRRGGSIDISQACSLAWETVTALYFLEDATEQQQTLWRKLNDRDVRHALGVLEHFGALRLSEKRATLTELGSWWTRRTAGESSQGDPVLQVKISLLGVSKPPVWRRLLVPADIRLDRLHGVIQAAMGWEDYHMHACPPEDCGGVWGYEHLCEVLADPVDEEHGEMLEWLGLQTAVEFNPARFDAEEVNRALGVGEDVRGWSVYSSEDQPALAVRRAA